LPLQRQPDHKQNDGARAIRWPTNIRSISHTFHRQYPAIIVKIQIRAIHSSLRKSQGISAEFLKKIDGTK
jgi:hypothetical protein